MASKCVKLKVC